MPVDYLKPSNTIITFSRSNTEMIADGLIPAGPTVIAGVPGNGSSVSRFRIHLQHQTSYHINASTPLIPTSTKKKTILLNGLILELMVKGEVL